MSNAALELLRKLAIRDHVDCEDSWYSCPKSEGGCANDRRGPECDCGADTHNAEVERVFAEASRYEEGLLARATVENPEAPLWRKGWVADQSCRDCDGTGVFYGNVCLCHCIAWEQTGASLTQEEYQKLDADFHREQSHVD